jgi:hypothetical protein
MDFSRDEDQIALAELARKILEECAPAPRLKEIEAGSSRVDMALWRQLADAGLLGVGIDEAWGGSGLGWGGVSVLLHEVGRAVAPVPVYPALILGALPIAAFGSAEQKQRWLPSVSSGDVILTSALGARVEALSEDGGWRLSGELPGVPAAAEASRIGVVAACDGGGTLFALLDPGIPGIRVESVETMDRQARAHVTLDGVRVEADDVLGGGDGAEIAAWLERRATLGTCALQVGVCERALEMAAAYVSERKQFGRPVGSFQAVHTRAADAYIDLQSMQLTYWRGCHALEYGDDEADELIAIAKYWASEAGARVTAAAQHLHGGIGVDVDYPLHRTYLWARQLGMQLGAGAEQLARIGAGLAR